MTAEDTAARRHTLLVGAGILLSRLSGLARERAVAHFLGAGAAVDAWRAALRIPNLMQNLLGEGTLSASFIPVYSRLLADGDEEAAGRVAGAVAGLLAVLAGALAVIGVVFAGPLTAALAPGFTGARAELTVTLVRILTPGIGLLVLSAWCLGVLNSHRRFFLSYVAPVLWNGAQIGAVVSAAALLGPRRIGLVEALAWGALVGSVAQFAIQFLAVRRTARITWSLRADLDGVQRVIRAFGPVLLGRGVVQVSAYVDLVLASLLATGAVATLGFAQQLYILPVSLFGMSVAAAELPALSTGPAALRRVAPALARVAFLVAPVVVAYTVLGDVVVGAVFRTGAFGAAATQVVWLVLAAYTLGLLPGTSARVLQNVLYARGDTRTPATIAALRVAVATAVGVLAMFQLDRLVVDAAGTLRLEGALPAFGPLPAVLREATDGLRLGAAGLAAGAAAGAWLEWWLLRRAVAARGLRVPLGGGELGHILAGALPAAAVAALLRMAAGGLHPLIGVVVAGLPTAAVYLAVTHRLGVAEAAAVVSAVRRVAGAGSRRPPPPGPAAG